MPTIDGRLEELVRLALELRSRGEPVMVEDLCRDCPELTVDLCRLLEGVPSTDHRGDTADRPKQSPVSQRESNKSEPVESADLPSVKQSSVPQSASDDLVPGNEPVPGYTLVQRLGRGGFGEVWQASGPGGFSVAMKFVTLATKKVKVEQRSLDIIKSLRHANLLSTFGSWQTARYLVIAMELADGTLLDRYHKFADRGLPGIPRDDLLEYLHQAATGIDFLNGSQNEFDGHDRTGVQHRDIKPENILLAGNSVKVADFGLARLLEHTQTGHTGSLTPHYAAPEFFEGHTSQHSDQYSLAISYCQLRTGETPFGGSVAEIMRGHLMLAPDLSMLPPEEQPVVARALAKQPTERWPSCVAFVNALKTSTQIQPLSPTGVSRGAVSRRVRLSMLGGAALVLAVIVGMNGWLPRFSRPDTREKTRSDGAAAVAARELATQAEKSAEQARKAYESLVAEFAAAGQVADVQSASKAWESGTAALAATEFDRAIAQFELARHLYEQAMSHGSAAQKVYVARQKAEQSEKSAGTARQAYLTLVAQFAVAGQLAAGVSATKAWDSGTAAVAATEYERAQAQFESARGLYEQARSQGLADQKAYIARQKAEQSEKSAGTARQAYLSLVAQFAAAGQLAAGVSATKAWESGKAALAATEYERAQAQFESASGLYEQARSLGLADQKTYIGRQKAEQSEKSAEIARQAYTSLVAQFAAAGQAAEGKSAMKAWEAGKVALASAEFDRAQIQFELASDLYEQARTQGVAAQKVYMTALTKAEQAVSKATTSLKEWEAAQKASLAALKTPPAALAQSRQMLQEASRQLARGEFAEATQSAAKAALLLDQAKEQIAQALGEFVSQSTGMKLVLIDAGEFEMGSRMSKAQLAAKFAATESNFEDEFPAHNVKISKPFYMGQHETTVGQFRKFVTDDGYKTEAETDGKGGWGFDESKGTFGRDVKYSWRSPGFTQADDHPVVNVTWNDAQKFCAWLSQKDGQKYRLPTEAEWEYACKGGSTSLWWNGDDAEELAQVGNIADGTLKAKFDTFTWTISSKDGYAFTAPVGKFKANPFGLFDMHGNVWEWCEDIYDAKAYEKRGKEVTDPLLASGSENRVLRGGSWSDSPGVTRTADRRGDSPDSRSNSIGFRVVAVGVRTP